MQALFDGIGAAVAGVVTAAQTMRRNPARPDDTVVRALMVTTAAAGPASLQPSLINIFGLFAQAGAIAGAACVIASRAVVDVWTAAIAVTAFAGLWRWKVSEIWVIAAAGAMGLAIGRFL